jgi:hypothetical protein
MAWNPPFLSVLTKVDTSGILVQAFNSLSRELDRLQREIDDLKKKVQEK